MPAGNAADKAPRSTSGSIGAMKVSSAYSPVEDTPTGRASGNDTLACGVNPSEYAIGRSARRNDRSQTEDRSRAETKRVRPVLVQRMRKRWCTEPALLWLTHAPVGLAAPSGRVVVPTVLVLPDGAVIVLHGHRSPILRDFVALAPVTDA